MIAGHLANRTQVKVKHQRFATTTGQRGENLIATLGPGTADLLISAHYDGDGAYDNASGVVGLLLLADQIRRDPLAGTITCAFFDHEEGGQEGARFYAASLQRRWPRAHVAIDGLGIGPRVVGAFNMRSLRVRCGQEWHQVECRSDASVFQDNGIPSVHCFSLPAAEADSLVLEGTAPKSWAILHSPRDHPDIIDMMALETNISDLFCFLRPLQRVDLPQRQPLLFCLPASQEHSRASIKPPVARSQCRATAVPTEGGSNGRPTWER